MAANTLPLFVASPFIGLASMSAANTGRDGSGVLVSLVTGSVNGSRVDWIQLKAEGTTVAGVVRFYIGPWGSGSLSNTALYDEVATSAVTPSATLPSYKFTYYPPRPLILPSGSILWVSSEKAGEGMQVLAFGGNF